MYRGATLGWQLPYRGRREDQDRSGHEDGVQPYFVKLRDAARAAADAHGAEVFALAGRFDGDNEGQVTAIENLVRQGVSGILITPSSTGGVLGAIKLARQQGVIVISNT